MLRFVCLLNNEVDPSKKTLAAVWNLNSSDFIVGYSLKRVTHKSYQLRHNRYSITKSTWYFVVRMLIKLIMHAYEVKGYIYILIIM